MAEVNEEFVSSAKVRDLIFAYERQSSFIEPLEDFEGRQRAKSIGNALSYKLFRQPNIEIHNIVDIEKELVKIEAHLNYYEIYEKETHVAFQEQLFKVLTYIVSIDPEEYENLLERKKNLIGETQKLARILNSKLPFDGNRSYRTTGHAYVNVGRREEAVVSTTSESREHRAFSNSTVINGRFKSEESINSTRDSVELSSVHDDLSLADNDKSGNTLESTPLPPQETIVNEVESNPVPSVSKLRKFFSFRKNDRSELKVTSAAYSGVSRSQSFNLKTSRYNIFKREEHNEVKKREENQQLITSPPIKEENEEIKDNEIIKEHEVIQLDNNSVPEILYVEPVKEIEEYREVEREAQHNVSVSKLKRLFEDQQTETEEGNYMNFAGILRNVDIEKKSEVRKSKSMSDLKSHHLRYEAKDVDNNLLAEIDDDDDDDFEHLSIDMEKENSELNNNNSIKTVNETRTAQSSEDRETSDEFSELVVGGKVGVLKKNFESLSTGGAISEQRNENIKHIIHRTVQSIPKPVYLSVEPVVTTPTDIKTHFAHVSHSGNITENKTELKTNEATTSSNVQLQVPIELTVGEIHTSNIKERKQITAESQTEVKGNIETVKRVSEPKLQTPIQLRVGTVNISNVHETKDISSEATLNQSSKSNTSSGFMAVLKETFENLTRSNVQDVSENVDVTKTHKTNEVVENTKDYPENTDLHVPVRLRSSSPEILSTSSVEDSTSIVRQSSKISSGSIAGLRETFENLSRSNSQESNENVNLTRNYKTIEAVENIEHSFEKPIIVQQAPVQLSTSSSEILSTSNEENSSSTTLNQRSNTSSGSIAVLKETFENLSRSISQDSGENVKVVTTYKTNEPVGKIEDSSDKILVPIQLKTDSSEILHTSSEGNSSTVVVAQSSTSNGSLQEGSGNLNVIGTYKTIEALENTKGAAQKPVAPARTQLKSGSSEITHTSSVVDSTKVSSQSNNTSSGSIAALKETFENLSRSDSQEGNEKVNLITTYKETEAVENSNGSNEKTLEKAPISVPIELRTSSSEALYTITKENSSTVVDQSSTSSSGSIAFLKETFEDLNRSNSQEGIENVNNAITTYTIIQPRENSKSISENRVVNVPVQLRTAEILRTSSKDNSSSVINLASNSSSGSQTLLNETVAHVTRSNGQEGSDNVNEIRTDKAIVEHTADSVQKPVVTSPVQLRTSSTEVLHTSSEENSSSILNQSSDNSSGSIASLKETFENLNRSNSQDGNEKDKVIRNSNAGEVIESTTHSYEKIAVKAPVQLRTDSSEIIQISGEASSTNILNQSTDISSGSIASLKETFESVSRSTSQDGNESANVVKTIQAAETSKASPEKLVVKPLVQLRTGLSEITHTSTEVNSANVSNQRSDTSSGSTAVLKDTFENLSRSNSQDNNSENVNIITAYTTTEPVDNTKDSSEKTVLRVPTQLRTSSSGVLHTSSEGSSSTVLNQSSNTSNGSLSLQKGNLGNFTSIDSQVGHENVNVIRTFKTVEAVESSTGSAEMRVLKVPMELKSSSSDILNSSFSQGQHVSSSSKVSGSFSQTRTVHRTVSNQVSHRIVSSSSSSQSSELSSSKYFHLLSEPSSYPVLTTGTADTPITDTEGIVELEDSDKEEEPTFNMNVSQEYLIDEILQDSDGIDNLDEKFEKLLQGNS